MAPRWDEGDLKNAWNSMFDASEFMACKENDLDLQSVSMLLKKTFHLYKNLRDRCDEAEVARRQPCQRCSLLEKEVAAKEEKLKLTESRMKSIAQILNMGGFTQEKNVSPSKQQSMAQALTQILMYDRMEISEDESNPEERGLKRKKYGPMTPIKVNVIPQQKSPDLVVTATKRSIGKEDVIVHESLPVQKRPADRALPKEVVLESLCSQTSAPTHVEFLSDNDETFIDLPVAVVTTPKMKPSRSQNSTSPIIGKGSASRKLKLRNEKRNLNNSFEGSSRDDGSCTLETSSPPLSSSFGLKKSPFTPKLRITKDKIPVINLASGSSDCSTPTLLSTPNIHSKDKAKYAFVNKNTIPSNFARRLVTTPDIFVTKESPSLLREMIPLSRPNSSTHRPKLKDTVDNGIETDSSSAKPPITQESDFGQIKSTGNSEIDNILDIMCDTNLPTKTIDTIHSKASTSKKIFEHNISNPKDSSSTGLKKQADFWKLKPSLTSKEPISMGNAAKLKQTKLGFGVHPETTDLCTLKEFNGGVRQSQDSPDTFTLRDFNAGIRPSLTSTMLPHEIEADYNEEAAFERAILETLKNTNTQYIPDEEEDIIAPSPDVTLSKRFVSSQSMKQCHKNQVDKAGPSRRDNGDVNLKENKGGCNDKVPNTQDLLEEMGMPGPSLPRLSLGTAELIRGFDQVPKRQEDSPAYKYQRDAVRKKDERKKLGGWDCRDCKKYYASRVNNSAERKKLMDKCSKHRSKYKRRSTPQGYWDPYFPSTPELRARNLDITQKPVKFRTRKNRPHTPT